MRTVLPGSRRVSMDDQVRQRMDTLFGPDRLDRSVPRQARPAPAPPPPRTDPPSPSPPAPSPSPPTPAPSPAPTPLPEPSPPPFTTLPSGLSPEPFPGRPLPRRSLSERLRSLLPLAVQERIDLDRRAVVGLVVLLVLALGYGVQHFWAGRPVPVAVPAAEASGTVASAVSPGPTARATGTGATGGAPAGASGTTAGAGAATGGTSDGASGAAGVVVDVAGRVRAPGVRTLRPGSRVQDALRAAGGALAGTDLTNLNLARLVNDGEEIVVGGPAVAAAPGTAGSVPLSLNTATAEQLDALPGLGPVLVQRIIQYRDQHGGFRSVDQLAQITGFGERRLKDLRPLLRP